MAFAVSMNGAFSTVIIVFLVRRYPPDKWAMVKAATGSAICLRTSSIRCSPVNPAYGVNAPESGANPSNTPNIMSKINPKKKSGKPFRLINTASMVRSVLEPRRHPDSIPSTIPKIVEIIKEVPTINNVHGRLPRITFNTEVL